MKLLTMNELEELSATRGDSCVSIYLPTHRGGHETINLQDARLLKTLLQDIKKRLQERGFNEDEAMDYLKPAANLIDDTGFWRRQLDGLALFISDDYFRYYRLPFTFEQFSLLTNSFYLKPLAPAFVDEDFHYILAISLQNLRLFEANRFFITELKLQELFPKGVDEILNYYDFERSLQVRAQYGRARAGGEGQQYYGGGSSRDNTPYIKEYFKHIDNGLKRIMTSNPPPMIIAGVEELHPTYKEANTAASIMDEGIFGNADLMKQQELHEKGKQIMEPYYQRQRERRKEKYQRLAGTGKTSYNIEEIARAAFNGRVEALFTTRNSNVWGKVFGENGHPEFEIHERFEKGDNCLIDQSVVKTILNGGETYIVDEEHLPEISTNAKVAAVFRY